MGLLFWPMPPPAARLDKFPVRWVGRWVGRWVLGAARACGPDVLLPTADGGVTTLGLLWADTWKDTCGYPPTDLSRDALTALAVLVVLAALAEAALRLPSMPGYLRTCSRQLPGQDIPPPPQVSLKPPVSIHCISKETRTIRRMTPTGGDHITPHLTSLYKEAEPTVAD